MKASDAMSSQVRTLLPTDDVVLAMQIMVGARISGLPVADHEGRLVGMLTEGDLLRRPEIDTVRRRPRWLEVALGSRRLAREYVDTHSRHVGDIMTTEVVTIDENASLSEAVRLMEKHGIKRLPVMHEGSLIGMLSRSDLLRALIQAAPRRGDSIGFSDAGIQERIDKEILDCPWIVRPINILVKNGDVDIEGVVTDDVVRDAIRVLVENVPGVREVRNRLSVDGPAGNYF